MIQNLIQYIDRLIQQRPAAKTALAPFRELALLMIQIDPDIKPVEVEKGIRQLPIRFCAKSTRNLLQCPESK